MGLSSNVLWHQTKKEGLRSIIKNKCLYYAYSVENIISNPSSYNYSFAFPMISVCDLPLAETGNYLKKYGDYTIGFDSEWGKRNGFSTVWYCDSHSKSLYALMNLFVSMINKYGFDTTQSKEYQNIVYLLSYVKQYEGSLPKKNFKNYRFYDEREQRIVPDFSILSQYSAKQFITNYEDYKKNHRNTSFLSTELNVPFKWDDLKYVVVEKDEEKDEIKELIKNISKKNNLNISFFTNKEVKEDIIGLNHDEKDVSDISYMSHEEIKKMMEDIESALGNI